MHGTTCGFTASHWPHAADESLALDGRSAEGFLTGASRSRFRRGMDGWRSPTTRRRSAAARRHDISATTDAASPIEDRVRPTGAAGARRSAARCCRNACKLRPRSARSSISSITITSPVEEVRPDRRSSGQHRQDPDVSMRTAGWRRCSARPESNTPGRDNDEPIRACGIMVLARIGNALDGEPPPIAVPRRSVARMKRSAIRERPSRISAAHHAGFCNGPWVVNPSSSCDALSPGSCFCPGRRWGATATPL